MHFPYIFTIDRHFICDAIVFDNERGVTCREVGGEHSTWAARMPFLPAMLSENTQLGERAG